MKIAVEFRDPQSAAAIDVRGLLQDPSPLQAASPAVVTQLPLKAPQSTIVVVRSGPWIEYQEPVTAVNRVRIVVYDQDADRAWDGASWLHGRLLAFGGDEDVLAYRYDLGPQRDVDPQNQTPFAAFTIRARMRFRQIDAPAAGGRAYGAGAYGEGTFG